MTVKQFLAWIRTTALPSDPLLLSKNTLIDMESVDPRKLEELLLKTKPSYSNFPVANEIPNREPLVWMLDTPLKYFYVYLHL